MPLYFRKSVRFGSGMRMNLSKSGVGFSVGAKGCRVSTGPRGTYVNVGAGGIYYRQKIGGAYGQSVAPPLPQPSYTYTSGTPILNASADQLVDSTSAAMLERMNSTIKQPAYAWMFVVGGAILGVVLANLHPILFVAVLAFGLYLASIARQMDKERRTYILEYNLDDTARARWVAMNTAIAALTKMTYPRYFGSPHLLVKRNCG